MSNSEVEQLSFHNLYEQHNALLHHAQHDHLLYHAHHRMS